MDWKQELRKLDEITSELVRQVDILREQMDALMEAEFGVREDENVERPTTPHWLWGGDSRRVRR